MALPRVTELEAVTRLRAMCWGKRAVFSRGGGFRKGLHEVWREVLLDELTA